jgi:hypothetical protein
MLEDHNAPASQVDLGADTFAQQNVTLDEGRGHAPTFDLDNDQPTMQQRRHRVPRDHVTHQARRRARRDMRQVSDARSRIKARELQRHHEP